MENRCGIIEVSLELLAEVLKLPEGTKIKAIFPPDPWKYEQNTFFMRIEHEKLHPVQEN